MASLTSHGGGWLIQYISDGKRRSFYPGKMPKRDAQSVRRHLENLLSARRQRTAVCDETAAWVAAQDLAMREKLHHHGLIEKPTDAQQPETLGAFVASYITSRGDAKPTSKTVWRRCERLLLSFFDADKPLASFGVGDAKDFRQWMLREGNQKSKGTGLEENTARKMCSVASQFFADALDREIVARNPFTHKDIPRTTRENRTRDFFIGREIAGKVLRACPNAQWRLLFALSRFGGLRCPSEHLALRWADVDWEAGRIVVTSPKTAHHRGKESRVVPLFPELRPYLEAVRDEAEDDAEFLITRYRSTEANLRTQLHRIIKSAGLKPWPKAWHNLRASRETELAAEYPIHVVCAWIGNSTLVASRHYLQVREEDFRRASDPMQNPMQNLHASDCKPLNGKTNCIGSTAENARKWRKSNTRKDLRVDVTGLEPVTSSV